MRKNEMSPEQRNSFNAIEAMFTDKTVAAKYSLDHKWFYVNVPNPSSKYSPRYWMSVEVEEGPIPEGAKEPNILEPLILEIKLNSGRVYRRKCLPFNFWKVNGGEEFALERDSDMFKDYASLHINHKDWPDENIGSESFESETPSESLERRIAELEQKIAYSEHHVVPRLGPGVEREKELEQARAEFVDELVKAIKKRGQK